MTLEQCILDCKLEPIDHIKTETGELSVYAAHGPNRGDHFYLTASDNGSIILSVMPEDEEADTLVITFSRWHESIAALVEQLTCQ
mgnify:FL=1